MALAWKVGQEVGREEKHKEIGCPRLKTQVRSLPRLHTGN